MSQLNIIPPQIMNAKNELVSLNINKIVPTENESPAQAPPLERSY
jgi:hypothetical protein